MEKYKYEKHTTINKARRFFQYVYITMMNLMLTASAES